MEIKSRASMTLLLQTYGLFDGHFVSMHGIFKWDCNLQQPGSKFCLRLYRLDLMGEHKAILIAKILGFGF